MSTPVYGVHTRKRAGHGTDSESAGESISTGRNTMNFESETIDGYAVPMDPMDMLQCDSCQ
jgi:hypothetical protein